MSSNDDKRMQSIGLIETYQYGTIKDLVSENKDIKFNNTIDAKKINFDKCYKRKHKTTWSKLAKLSLPFMQYIDN